MKTKRNIYTAIATMMLLAAIASPAQEVRITGLDTSTGRLDFTLSPQETVSDYACSVEWRSTLTAGSWTNVWYTPFASFASSNGMFYAAIPRFFRIRCEEGQTTIPPPANYTVTGVVPSQTTDGVIYWPDNGSSNLTYYVEQATGADGPWLSQWAGHMNIHAAETTTNSFDVPLFFRVVTIAESGELPW